MITVTTVLQEQCRPLNARLLGNAAGARSDVTENKPQSQVNPSFMQAMTAISFCEGTGAVGSYLGLGKVQEGEERLRGRGRVVAVERQPRPHFHGRMARLELGQHGHPGCTRGVPCTTPTRTPTPSPTPTVSTSPP